MSMYELLDLLFSAVRIIITIILHLFPNRKESDEYGRSIRSEASSEARFA